MGEAKKRIVGNRKRAESPTEGHNTLLLCVARSVFAAIPTYLPAIGLCVGGTGVTCDRPLRGKDTTHCVFARRVSAAIPTYNTIRYKTKAHTCDRPHADDRSQHSYDH